MAKGKSAAALFEVIHGGNRAKSAETKLSTPKWWFKSHKRDFSVVAPIEVAAPDPAPMDVMGGSDQGGSGSRGFGLGGLKVILPSSQTVAIGLTLAAVFGVGFVVGQRFHTVGSPVIAEETTEELIAGTANPEVLEIADPAPVAAAATPSAKKADPAAANASLVPSAVNTAPTLSGTLPPSTSVVNDKQRVIGYNYVIVQSYPDEESALKAVAVLADAGIGSSVVKGPPGWAASTWYSVVGTTGFSKIRGVAAYDKYVAAIERVSAKFAGKSKFKEFAPRAYKWKTAEPTVAGTR